MVKSWVLYFYFVNLIKCVWIIVFIRGESYCWMDFYILIEDLEWEIERIWGENNVNIYREMYSLLVEILARINFFYCSRMKRKFVYVYV